MKNTRAEELMAAYLSGNLKAGERKELMQWVEDSPEGRSFFDKAISLWSITEQMAYPDFSAGKAQSWNKINQRLETSIAKPGVHRGIRRLNILRWSAAAAIALLAIAGWWWTNQQTDTFVAATLTGERQELNLPDGTTVWLNENSHLTYEDHGDERYIAFEGEAFFDVATDSIRPFRVYSGQAVTTVLGTSFNLRAYPQEENVEVSVKEGRVALARQEEMTKADDLPIAKERVELSRGETGVLEKSTAAVTTVELKQDNSTAWKDRRLGFDDVPLAEVVQTLERYYSIKIDLVNAGIGQCLVTLGEEKDPDLALIMALLEGSVDLSIEQEGKIYRFSGQSCK